MSFGSQGEIAYRAYAEAAFQLNMLSINGEGGEIPDLLGKYPFNRGIQIASGRFGITAETINATNLLEIKVGQRRETRRRRSFTGTQSYREGRGGAPYTRWRGFDLPFQQPRYLLD